MYDDDPGWQLYMNALDCMYKENAVKIDIAGTVESISKIDKDVLYKCYNTFYNPSNMVLVVCGEFNPEEILQQIKNRLVQKENQSEIKRIYPESEKGINKKQKETQMQVSKPIFLIGFKDENLGKDKVKRHIAIEILMNMLVGKSSPFYQKLYNEGLLVAPLDMDYEFTDNYAHVMLTGQSKEPLKIKEELLKQIEKLKQNINEEYFNRIKKKVYGDYVVEYNNVADIARMFLSDYFKGINSFDYIEQYNTVTAEYTKEILNELFDEKNSVLSVVNVK